MVVGAVGVCSTWTWAPGSDLCFGAVEEGQQPDTSWSSADLGTRLEDLALGSWRKNAVGPGDLYRWCEDRKSCASGDLGHDLRRCGRQQHRRTDQDRHQRDARDQVKAQHCGSRLTYVAPHGHGLDESYSLLPLAPGADRTILSEATDMSSEPCDDAARAEIRAYLRQHPEVTLQEIVATVMRDQPPDDLDFRSMISEAWATAGGDVDEFWALLEDQHPEAAEALKDVVLVPDDHRGRPRGARARMRDGLLYVIGALARGAARLCDLTASQ